MAIQEYYVDYNAGNDTTGDGTIGTPWKTTQKALNTINHGGNGARINVKDDATEVLTAQLSYTTYLGTNGAGSATEPLIIQGYTSAAGDGGIGAYEGTTNSCAFWGGTDSQDADYVTFRDLTITTGQATGYAITIDNQITIYNCTLTSPDNGIDIDNGTVSHCKIVYNGTGIGTFATTSVTYNYMIAGNAALESAIIGASTIIGNIIDVSAAGDAAQPVIVTSSAANSEGTVIAFNTIYAAHSGNTDTQGIEVAGHNTVCVNNYIEGFSGTGNEAINVLSSSVSSIVANNLEYNCTDTVTDAGLNTIATGNATTSASGLTNAASSDFTPTSELTDAGFPASYLGLSGNANYLTVGAITDEHAASGGGFIANTNQVAG